MYVSACVSMCVCVCVRGYECIMLARVDIFVCVARAHNIMFVRIYLNIGPIYIVYILY